MAIAVAAALTCARESNLVIDGTYFGCSMCASIEWIQATRKREMSGIWFSALSVG